MWRVQEAAVDPHRLRYRYEAESQLIRLIIRICDLDMPNSQDIRRKLLWQPDPAAAPQQRLDDAMGTPVHFVHHVSPRPLIT
jgi:hypothetical protein